MGVQPHHPIDSSVDRHTVVSVVRVIQLLAVSTFILIMVVKRATTSLRFGL